MSEGAVVAERLRSFPVWWAFVITLGLTTVIAGSMSLLYSESDLVVFVVIPLSLVALGAGTGLLFVRLPSNTSVSERAERAPDLPVQDGQSPTS